MDTDAYLALWVGCLRQGVLACLGRFLERRHRVIKVPVLNIGGRRLRPGPSRLWLDATLIFLAI